MNCRVEFNCTVFASSLFLLIYLTDSRKVPNDPLGESPGPGNNLNPSEFEDALKEIRDPCQTAEILEHPWRHWTYDDSEVPMENGRKKYECDADWLPIRRWFGFSVNGIRSEIIYGHVKSHRCGTLHPVSLSFERSLLFQQSMLYPQLRSNKKSAERYGYGGDGDDGGDDNDSDDDDDDDDGDVGGEEDLKIFRDKRHKNLQNRSSKSIETTSSSPRRDSSPTSPSIIFLSSSYSSSFPLSSTSSSSSSLSPPTLKLHSSSAHHDGTDRHTTSQANEDQLSTNSSSASEEPSTSIFPPDFRLNSSATDDFSSPSSSLYSSSSSSFSPSSTSGSERKLSMSLPRYEREYDSIFESHSRKLYSYMFRELDVIQELQQFLSLQHLHMNSSIVSRELRKDRFLSMGIEATLDYLHRPEQNSTFMIGNETGENVPYHGIDFNASDYRRLLKELSFYVRQRGNILEKRIKSLSDEREKLNKLRKTKLHSKRKTQRFLRQKYTIAQLCVYHRFLEESSCAHALSVPIVIKKCLNGSVYWLEKKILRCPSGICVKKINETASYEVFLNTPREELMLKPLSKLVDRDLKSVVSIEFDLSTDEVNIKALCTTLRPILAKKFKLALSTKSRSPRKFLKVKGKPVERNYTRTFKEEKFEGAVITDIDSDASGPHSHGGSNKKIKRSTGTSLEILSNKVEELKAALEPWGGIDSLTNRGGWTNRSGWTSPTTAVVASLESRGHKEVEEELTAEELEMVKFVDYENMNEGGAIRLSVFIDGNTALTQADLLDAIKSLNASGELDVENMTIASIYNGFPEYISLMRSGGRAARLWQENKDMFYCAFVVLGILSLFAVICVLCRTHKTRKRKRSIGGGKRYHKSAQTDHLITGYIFGTSTPVVPFGSRNDCEDLVMTQNQT